MVDSDRRTVGIVTEVDLLRGEYSATPESLDSPVEQVMTSPAFGMGAGSSAALLARVMVDDRVPIVDGLTVVGVVTHRDVVHERVRGRATFAEVEESEADLERFRSWPAKIAARDYFDAPAGESPRPRVAGQS